MTKILFGGELIWRGGVRLTDAPGSIAPVYDVNLGEAMQALPNAFRSSLETILTHMINEAVAKGRMTMVPVYGPVYTEESINSSSVASRE
jgi:hypothetical protein